MKKILITLMIGLSLLASVKAADVSFALTSAVVGNTTNLIDGGASINAISFVNGSSVAVNYSVWDAPATNSTAGPAQFYFSTSYSNGPVVKYQSYITNITKMVTNFFGVTNSVTSSNVLWTYPVTTPAQTNFYRLIAAGQAAASTTVTIPLEGPLTVVRGLTVTNHFSTNSSWRINYSPSL